MQERTVKWAFETELETLMKENNWRIEYFGARPASFRNIRLRLKCDGTRAENIFRLSAKQKSPFKSTGGVVSLVDYWQPRCADQR